MATYRDGRHTGDGVRARTAWWGAIAALVLALASPSGRAQVVPSISISDVVVTEGNSGVTVATATVTLQDPNAMETRVRFTTRNQTATGHDTTRSFTATGGAIPDAGAPLVFTWDTSTLTAPPLSGSVSFQGLSHPSPDHLDALLVAPNGETMVVQSDVGGAPVSGITLTLRDYQRLVTSLLPGVFAPTSFPPADSFGPPAPAGPYPEAAPAGTASLDDLVRRAPLGFWRLYVVDDTPGGQGTLNAATLNVDVPRGGIDYGRLSGEIAFAPGAPLTQTIKVPIVGDTDVEPNETFEVTLSSPVNGLIGDDMGIVTILNDDGGSGGLPPTAVADTYADGLSLGIVRDAENGVLSNDVSNGGGPMTAVLVSGPTTGDLVLRGDGSFSYRPPLDRLTYDVVFTYRAVDAAGSSAVVSVRLIDGLSARVPTNFEVAKIIGGVPQLGAFRPQVVVRFDPPVLGPAPDQYALSGGVVPGQTLAQIFTGSPNPIYEFTAPASGSYFIRVHGVTGGVIGAPSNEVPLNLDTTVAPSAPANLLGAADGSHLTLAWKNTFTGGLPTNSFLRVTGAVSLTVPLGQTDTFSYAGVPDGTYTFEVFNGNASGPSTASNRVTLTFPGPCMPPEPPTDFLAYVNGRLYGAIWNLPTNGPAPNGYLLDVVSPIFTGRLPLRTTNIRANVVPGIYDVSVVATTACGLESAPTAVQRVVVQ